MYVVKLLGCILVDKFIYLFKLRYKCIILKYSFNFLLYMNILELCIVMYMYCVFVEVVSSSFIDISMLKLILLKNRKIFFV